MMLPEKEAARLTVLFRSGDGGEGWSHRRALGCRRKEGPGTICVFFVFARGKREPASPKNRMKARIFPPAATRTKDPFCDAIPSAEPPSACGFFFLVFVVCFSLVLNPSCYFASKELLLLYGCCRWMVEEG